MKSINKNIFVYSGSFNPLHAGHLAIAQYVESKYDTTVVFEICREPYDKSCLSDAEVDKRVSQFNLLDRKCLPSTHASFLAKSKAKFAFGNAVSHPDLMKCGLTFIVGHDTITRIGDAKYYFDSEPEVERCINLMQARGVSFLVFPRNGKLKDGIRRSLSEICYFADDFTESPISSSDIRRGMQ